MATKATSPLEKSQKRLVALRKAAGNMNLHPEDRQAMLRLSHAQEAVLNSRKRLAANSSSPVVKNPSDS
jgi:hypothetical protein